MIQIWGNYARLFQPVAGKEVKTEIFQIDTISRDISPMLATFIWFTTQLYHYELPMLGYHESTIQLLDNVTNI
mgnify:CR=1 FL=1